MTVLTPLSLIKKARTDQEAATTGYFGRVLRALDVFSNVLLGGLQDETISSRMGRWATEDKGIRKAVGTFLVRFLNLFESDHCAVAEESDKERAEIAVTTETTAEQVIK